MTLGESLISVWSQVLAEGKLEVELSTRRFAVSRTRAKGLLTVSFESSGARIDGIEQNPMTGSRWAKLAQEGQRIMQFRCQGRYIANVCEGKLLRYPAWKSLQLPE